MLAVQRFHAVSFFFLHPPSQVLLLLVPLNGWVARRQRALQGDQMAAKDERVRHTAHLLDAVKVAARTATSLLVHFSS